MRACVTLLIALGMLSACGKRAPDFSYSIKSPAQGVVATISGYQPRGTVEGYLLIAFGRNAESIARFRHVRNAAIGWTPSNEFVVVGGLLSFDDLRSSYFPDGATGSEVRLITCNRGQLNCASIEKRMIQGATRRIAQFPEGDWYVTSDAR